MNKSTDAFQKRSFLLYLAIAIFAFTFLVRDFLMPVLMAALFSGLTYPLYNWMKLKMKYSVLASILTILLLCLIIIIPLIGLGTLAYIEVMRILRDFEPQTWQHRVEGLLGAFQAKFPSIYARLISPESVNQIIGQAKEYSQILLKSSAKISFSIMTTLLQFGIMLLTMFYFYIDGPRILKEIINVSPLRDEYDKLLIQRFLIVSKGTLKGTLLIGLIQGVLTGILCFSVGMQSPIFLGSLAFFGTLLPIVGTALVWIPVALFLLINGAWIKCLIVILSGTVLVGSVDNILRPIFVGKDIKMHDLMVLFSTLGGIGIFGLVGVVVGPIIASFFLSILSIYKSIYGNELDENKADSGNSNLAIGQN